jgi:tungstate transport system ATP-binding protein
VIPVLELRSIRVVHDGRATLDVPSLDVWEGEVLAVIGPNGAGKSTLLRVMGLLHVPEVGTVRMGGELVRPAQMLAFRRRTASAFQEPLLADTTVGDNVALGLRFRGFSREQSRRRAIAWLERLGIAGLAERQARTLSGGEAQRTALARALVLQPEVLLLDEPFSALDQPSREALIDDLGRVLRADRVTTVFVTHDRGEARALGDRVAVLIGGRLLQVDETSQVFRAPSSEEVARFVGVETILAGTVIDTDSTLTVVRVAGWPLEVAGSATRGEWVRLCIRPEDVTLTAGAPSVHPATSARNHLPGRVLRVAPGGGQVRALIDCGFPLVALVTHRSADELGLREGIAVTAHFKATAAHMLRTQRTEQTLADREPATRGGAS